MRRVALFASRYARVADILATVKDPKFEMWQWGEERSHYGENDEPISCGTVACAAGWAAQDPYFKRLGLRLTWEGEVGFRSADINIEALFNIFGTDSWTAPSGDGWHDTRRGVIKNLRTIAEYGPFCQSLDEFREFVDAVCSSKSARDAAVRRLKAAARAHHR